MLSLPNVYEFRFQDNKLIRMSVHDYYTASYSYNAYRDSTQGHNIITEEDFRKYFTILCKDTNFTEFKEFLELLANDSILLPCAKAILLNHISEMAKKIRNIRKALETVNKR